MTSFAIYERPVDYPNHFVVRKYELDVPGDCQLFETLAAARASIPPGCTVIPPFGEDHPNLKEVWI